MQFDPPADLLKDLAAKGAVYIAGAQAVKVIIQFISVIILARLLTPEDFGVIAMVAPILAFMTLVQTLGLAQGIIQKPDLHRQDVNSVFWLNLAIGCVFVFILLVAAPAIAAFYKDPSITPFIMALSLIVLCAALNTVHEALLNRKMAFGQIAFTEISAALLTLSVSILCALYIGNYWALFYGTLSGVVWTLICFCFFSKWMPSRPAVSRGSMSILKFGAGVTGFNIVNFLERNLDNVLIGRMWGSTQLGLYDRAYKLLIFPLQQITNPLGKVIIPVLSRIVDTPERYRAVFLKAHGLVIWLVLPGVIFLLVTAEDIIPLLLGPQWIQAVPVFQLLACAGLLQPINNPCGWLYLSQGRGRDFAVAGTFNACITVAALIIGLPHGIIGVAMTYILAQILKTPFIWWYVTRTGAVTLSDILRSVLPFLCAIGVGLYSVRAVNGLFQLYNPDTGFLPLVGICVTSYIVFSAVILCFGRGRALLREALALCRMLIAKRSISSGSP